MECLDSTPTAEIVIRDVGVEFVDGQHILPGQDREVARSHPIHDAPLATTDGAVANVAVR